VWRFVASGGRHGQASASRANHFFVGPLPDDWQRMLQLRKEHSLVRVSELMGIPRRTIRDWLKQVAERFEEAGLRDYLG